MLRKIFLMIQSFDILLHNSCFKVIYDVSDMLNVDKTKFGSSQQSNLIDDYALYAAIPTNACLPSFKVQI